MNDVYPLRITTYCTCILLLILCVLVGPIKDFSGHYNMAFLLSGSFTLTAALVFEAAIIRHKRAQRNLQQTQTESVAVADTWWIGLIWFIILVQSHLVWKKHGFPTLTTRDNCQRKKHITNSTKWITLLEGYYRQFVDSIFPQVFGLGAQPPQNQWYHCSRLSIRLAQGNELSTKNETAERKFMKYNGS